MLACVLQPTSIVLMRCVAANLAGFLLQGSTLTQTITSISELQNQNQYTVCASDSPVGAMLRIGKAFPGLKLIEWPQFDQSSLVMDWRASMAMCDAWIVTIPSVKLMYSQAGLCQLTTVGPALYTEVSGTIVCSGCCNCCYFRVYVGWKTNQLSSCVADAVDYAFNVMSETNEVDLIIVSNQSKTQHKS